MTSSKHLVISKDTQQQHDTNSTDFVRADQLDAFLSSLAHTPRTNQYDSITLHSDTTYSPAFLSSLLATLKPGDGTLTAYVPSNIKLDTALIYAGFVDVNTQPASSNSNTVKIVCKKPSWSAGSVAKLQRRPAATVSNNAVKLNGASETKEADSTAPAAASAWKFGGSDSMLDDEYEDEDAILEREQFKPIINRTAQQNGVAECGPSQLGKKKACKNCTCGLAEAEERVKIDDLHDGDVLQVKSQCGSCGLGDAFRCAACPFLGKPAFKTDADNRVKLQL